MNVERTRPIYRLEVKSRRGSVDDIDVGRSTITILGFAMLAAAVIFVGRSYLKPAAEGQERDRSVLTGNLDPRLDDIFVLQDSELPKGVVPPNVGEDAMYVRVCVLYPSLPEVPEPGAHRLVRVNGHPAAEQSAAHFETEVDDEGARIYLTFRVGPDFETSDLARGKTTVLESLMLE